MKAGFAADFTGWQTDPVKFTAQIDRVIKALHAREAAREKPWATHPDEDGSIALPPAVKGTSAAPLQSPGSGDDPRRQEEVIMFPDPREVKVCEYVCRGNGVAGFQFTFWNGETRLFDATDDAIRYVVKNFRTDPPPNGKGR